MWRAYFRNDFVVDEFAFDANHQIILERSFSHVLDRHDLLEKLSILLDNGDTFTLDITKGLFSVNKNGQGVLNFFGLSQEKCAHETLSNVRIIYFCRDHVSVGVSRIGTSVSRPTTQFTALGFQANLVSGKNIQRYLAIYPDGTFDIRGEND